MSFHKSYFYHLCLQVCNFKITDEKKIKRHRLLFTLLAVRVWIKVIIISAMVTWLKHMTTPTHTSNCLRSCTLSTYKISHKHTPKHTQTHISDKIILKYLQYKDLFHIVYCLLPNHDDSQLDEKINQTPRRVTLQ